MKERVAQTLGRKEARGLMIATFHTLGLEIIKKEYVALGMKSNFSLFDAQDQMGLLKDLTHKWLEDDKHCCSNWCRRSPIGRMICWIQPPLLRQHDPSVISYLSIATAYMTPI